MATEPKSIRETNLRLEGIVGQFDLVQKMVWWVIGLLGALIAGAIAVWVQLGETRTSIALVQAEVKLANDKMSKLDERVQKVDDRVARLDARLDKINSRFDKSDKGLETAEARISALVSEFSRQFTAYNRVADVKLSPSDLSFLNGFFGPRFTNVPSFTKIGSVYVRGSDLSQIPEEVTSKIPGLRGYQWARDVDGSIVIADAEKRVVLILQA